VKHQRNRRDRAILSVQIADGPLSRDWEAKDSANSIAYIAALEPRLAENKSYWETGMD
jgi:hypothetical protein